MMFRSLFYVCECDLCEGSVTRLEMTTDDDIQPCRAIFAAENKIGERHTNLEPGVGVIFQSSYCS